MPLNYLWLFPVGILLGIFGTLIGAGGGFLLVPLLLLAYPKDPPEVITSISLAVVFFNALSGSGAYARMGRIDYRSGVLFSLATIPGAVLGALTTGIIPRHLFNIVFGILLFALCLYLLLKPTQKESSSPTENKKGFECHLTEADGTRHTYSYNLHLGMFSSVLVGYLSSLLGIGGGIIHVPVLARVLRFPVHVATATSHFVLAIMALAGTIVHISTGAFHVGWRRTMVLSIGVVIGAQIGAILSNKVQGNWILRGLAVALGIVGIRILLIG